MIPSRKYRRQMSGRLCFKCGLALHHSDMVLAISGNVEAVLHEACTRILMDEYINQEAEVDAAAQ